VDLLPYSYTVCFLFFGILFVLGGLVGSWVLRPRKPSAEKSSIYECGETPIGSAWMQFNVGYYLVAMVFVLFEVEVAFLFPWASVYTSLESPGQSLAIVGLFVGILVIADAYAWKKGALEWL
jgi:NADH-quinone oxidoreductase subunit A